MEADSRTTAVLNAIASTNGTARLLRRDLEQLRTEMQSHVETIRWLLTRVETVRAEVLNELRYELSPSAEGEPAPPTELWQGSGDGELKVNLGAGHLALEGFVNVDIRPLPGIDVVAPIDKLPFAPETVDEIFSAHTLEHFPVEQLTRRLLPYWFGLIRPGGSFRAVVPDIEATMREFASGARSFDNVRTVLYGGQEYEHDFHHNGFTPASLAALLEDAGFVRAQVLASGRQNGDCLECEVIATRPTR